jgi:hypothetical protein
MIIVVTLVCATLLVAQVLRAVIRRFEPRGRPDDAAPEIAQLRDRLAEVEEIAMRVPELEERVDFAERLLANRPDTTQLPLHRTPV